MVGLLVLSTALAGCTQPTVDKPAVTAYLNDDPTSKAPGCPFPVDEAAHEGIVDAPDAVDLAVTGDGRLLLAEQGRIVVVSSNYTRVSSWPLATSQGAVRIDAGPDLVAAIAGTTGDRAEVTTFRPDGTRIASRNISAAWAVGVAVHRDRVYVAHDPAPNGSDLTVLFANLTLDRRIDLGHPSDRLHRFDVCRDRVLWSGGGPPQGTDTVVRTVGLDGSDPGVVARYDSVARRLTVGQDLVFVSGGLAPRWTLHVAVLDGTDLVSLSNDKEESYGAFAVAHDLVYNLRGDAVLVRPLADFLTRPS